MSQKLQFDVGMNTGEFMTNARDIARAISSLKTTVVQTGKTMNSAATGYGTAMRQSIKASRDFESSVEGIKGRMAELERSTTAIKAAADKFTDLQKRISSTEKQMSNMVEQLSVMEDFGFGEASDVWKQNETDIANMTAELEKQKRLYADYVDAVEFAQKRLRTGKDEQGHGLTDEEKKTYSEESKYNQELADQTVERIKAAENSLNSLKQTQASLAAKGENGATQEYIELADSISQAEKRLNEMKESLKNMREAGYENADKSDAYTRQIEQLNRLRNALGDVQNVKNEALKPPYMESWENMTRISGMLSESFGRIQNAASGALYAITHPVEAVDRALGTLISKAGQAVSAFARMAGNGAVSFLKRLASEAKNAAIQLAKLAANAVSSGFKKIASGAAAAAKGILGFNRANKSSSGGLKTGLKNILKYAFGIRSMFFLFRRLRTAVSEGFGELKKQNPEVKASLDSLQTSLNGLKGSLASAFAPILTAVAPMLTTLINMLTGAMNTIAAFFAALGGGKTFSKAVGGLKATGKAAGGASKKAKDLKRQLAGFDELNILSKNKTGSGGSSGSGSGLKYQTEKISSAMQDFVKEIKELWDNGEYEKLGKLLGKHINKGLAKAYKAVKWDNVQKKWTKAIDAFTGIFNGLIKGIDWQLLGKTIGEGINTILESAKYLLTHIDFGSAGSAFATALNGLFERKDLFTKAAQTLSTAIKGLLNFGQMFVEKFNEGQVAEDIRNALTTGIEWEKIAEDTWKFIKTVFGKAGSFLNVLLGGENNAQDESISRLMRKKPTTITPEYKIDGTVFEDLADNFAAGINAFVKTATEFIESLSVSDVVGAVADWLIRIKNKIRWDYFGALMGTSLGKAFDVIHTISEKLRANAATDGANLAAAINHIVRTAFKGDRVASTFTNFVTGAFNFIAAFLEGFNAEDAADKLREEVLRVDWDGIARAAWNALSKAVSKLGNFLTVLLGGEINTDPSDAVGKAIRSGKSHQEAIQQVTNSNNAAGQNKSLGALVGSSIGGIAVKILNAITWAISNIEWGDVGTGIHDAIVNMPWVDIATALWEAIVAMASSFAELLIRAIFGKSAFNDYGLDHDSDSYTDDWMKAHELEQIMVTFGTTDDIALQAKIEELELPQEVVDNVTQAAQEKISNEVLIAEFGLDPEIDLSTIVELRAAIQSSLYNNEEELTLPFSIENNVETNKKLAAAAEEAKRIFAQELSKKSPKEESTEVGIDSADGTVEGYGSEMEAKTGEIQEDTAILPEAAREELDSHSPSRVFEAIGVDIVDGLILGLQTLPAALKGVWEGLPEWAQTLLGNAVSNFKLDVSGGVESTQTNTGNSGGDITSNTKASKKETKEVKKNTKEVKKNTKKRAEVDVNYEGAGFDTSGDKPKLNVDVNFTPADEDAKKENVGLLGWLQKLLDPGVSVETKVSMIKDGWTSFLGVLGLKTDNPTIGTLLKLMLDHFDDVLDFLGIGPDSPLATLLKLALDNAKNILDFLGIDPNTPIKTLIKLALNKFDSLLDFLGIPKNSPIRAVIDLLKGKFDEDADNAINADGKTVSIFATLMKAFGSKEPENLWNTAIQVLAGVGYAAGVNSNSVLGLFNWAKNAIANAPQRAAGVISDAVLNLFTWGSVVKANNVDRASGMVKEAILNLFTWNKGVTASGASRASNVTEQAVLNKFSWTKQVIAQSVARAKDLTEQAVLNKFTWTKSVVVGKPQFGDKVNKNSAVNLFNKTITIKTTLSKTIGNLSSWASSIASKLKDKLKGTTGATGGSIQAGGKTLHRFARGGVIRNGVARYLDNVPHYASGTSNAHGTVFVAGEAGPEILGHINGRTEILNKSQLADAIYSAVVNGMGQAVNALGSYLANHMTNCTNSIVRTIGANSGITQVSSLDYYAPSMVTNGIMPYDVSMQIARSAQDIQNTLNANNEDLIQSLVSAMGNAANSIVQVMQRQMMSQSVNRGLTTQQVIDGMNRQTMMFGVSPLKGV